MTGYCEEGHISELWEDSLVVCFLELAHVLSFEVGSCIVSCICQYIGIYRNYYECKSVITHRIFYLVETLKYELRSRTQWVRSLKF